MLLTFAQTPSKHFAGVLHVPPMPLQQTRLIVPHAWHWPLTQVPPWHEVPPQHAFPGVPQAKHWPLTHSVPGLQAGPLLQQLFPGAPQAKHWPLTQSAPKLQAGPLLQQPCPTAPHVPWGFAEGATGPVSGGGVGAVWGDPGSPFVPPSGPVAAAALHTLGPGVSPFASAT
jgi:hypothetical protein